LPCHLKLNGMNFLLVYLISSVVTTLAGIGATIIITKSFLFKGLQDLFEPKLHMNVDAHPYLNKLFNCPMCMGFWVGWLFQIIMVTVLQFHVVKVEPVFIMDAVGAFFQGCIVSVLSIITYAIMVTLNYDKE
jgi:hypothetical protein